MLLQRIGKYACLIALGVFFLLPMVGCPGGRGGDDDSGDIGEPLTNVEGRSYDVTVEIDSITGGVDCGLDGGDDILTGVITFSQTGNDVTVTRQDGGDVILSGTISSDGTINVSGTFDTTIFEGSSDAEDVRMTFTSTNVEAGEDVIRGTGQGTGVSLDFPGVSCVGTVDIEGEAT